MIRWTGLAPWELDFPFPGSLTSTLLQDEEEEAAEDNHRMAWRLAQKAAVAIPRSGDERCSRRL